MTAPKRRWFRFSLAAMFVGVAVFCVWLGWQVNAVHNRRTAIERIQISGGKVNVWGEEDAEFWFHDGPVPSVSFARTLLGDKPINAIVLPEGTLFVDREQIESLFSEANVYSD